MGCKDTRKTCNTHQLFFSSIHKGVMYSAIKFFNSLPPHITKLLNKKQQFKHALKEYLITHAFYSP